MPPAGGSSDAETDEEPVEGAIYTAEQCACNKLESRPLQRDVSSAALSTLLCAVSDSSTIWLALAGVAYLPWIHMLCLLYRFAKKCAKWLGGGAKDARKKEQKGGAAGAAALDAPTDSEVEDVDEKDLDEEERIRQLLNQFLDDTYTRGLDDSDQIAVNPVMTYKMNQAKKRARQACVPPPAP